MYPIRKKICIVTAGILPVPDTKGGAIERLVTMLVEDNEIYHRVDFTIVGCFEEKAVELQKNFKHTVFVNIKCKQPTPFLYKWGNVKARYHIRKWFGVDIHLFVPYLRKLDAFFSEKRNFDMIIAEGVDYEAMITATKYYGKEKVCCHLHMNPPISKNRDRIYGYTVAVSDYIINKYRQVSSCDKNNTATIFNGIDTLSFDKSILENDKLELRESLGLKADDFVLLFCGRIVAIKGVKELMEAMLRINNPKIKLLIIGSSNFGDGDKGDYPNEVKKIVENHSDRIKFTGFINNKELYKYHQIANVGVVPSTYQDPCPLSMFEMITSGLPTIATAAGGMVEIGSNDCTRFVSLSEKFVDDLRLAIEDLFSNKNKCTEMSIAAKKRSSIFNRKRFYDDFCNTIISFIK